MTPKSTSSKNKAYIKLDIIKVENISASKNIIKRMEKSRAW
jgi:hypothetical protein